MARRRDALQQRRVRARDRQLMLLCLDGGSRRLAETAAGGKIRRITSGARRWPHRHCGYLIDGILAAAFSLAWR
jgi:hypothetical protein